ncbi:MAG: outer membrane beta-barrel protein [Candidatus Zixiibacteriota bacterium]
MKKTVLICAVTLLFAVGASAQVPSPISVYIGGALSVPSSGNFNAGWQMGYHGMAGVGYKLSKNLMLSGKIEHHTFFFDLADFFGVDGGDTKVWMYGIDGRYTLNLPAIPLKPYVKAGSGIAKISWQEFESTDPSTTLTAAVLNAGITEASASKVYFDIGGGIELKAIPAFGLFAEARYVSVATDGERMSFVPMTIGLKFF